MDNKKNDEILKTIRKKRKTNIQQKSQTGGNHGII